mgnify:CR=1 FL=1
MDIRNTIEKASIFLKEKNIKSYLIDSELLLSKVISKDRKYIILNHNKSLEKSIINSFNELVKQRSLGKPVAYLLGKKFFWKDEFKVNNDVLIPRPDTEIIVEQVLKITKNKSNLRILDIGVGSGCILLSILREKNKFSGVGIDISKKSLNICKINTHKLKLAKRVKFFKSDIDNFNYGKYDLIISNPPYINKFDLKYLDKDVIDYEPKHALDGGLDGLSEIRKVINKSSELIKIKGLLILEIAFDQRKKVEKLLRKKGFYINKIIKDYSNNDRCIVCTKI